MKGVRRHHDAKGVCAHRLRKINSSEEEDVPRGGAGPAALKQATEALLVVRVVHRVLGLDFFLPDEAVQVLLQGGLPLVSALPHHLVDLAHVVILDRRAGGGVHPEHLFRHLTAAANLGEQLLRDDAPQHVGEAVPHALLLLGGHLRHDAVDGLHGRRGVERGEDLVARVGDFEGRLDRRRVPHLPDHHNVGVLTQGLRDAGLEGRHVLAHLAVAHDALLRLVHVLHRLGNHDDVARKVLVVRVDDGVERGAFPRPRDARNQGQPVPDVPKHHALLNLLVEAQVLQRKHLVGDGAHVEGRVVVVRVRRGPEPARPAVLARDVFQPVRKVRRPRLQKLLGLLLVEEVENEDVGFQRVVRPELVFASLLPVDPVPHVAVTGPAPEVHVTGVQFQRPPDELVDVVSEGPFAFGRELGRLLRQVSEPPLPPVRLRNGGDDLLTDVRQGGAGIGLRATVLFVSCVQGRRNKFRGILSHGTSRAGFEQFGTVKFCIRTLQKARQMSLHRENRRPNAQPAGLPAPRVRDARQEEESEARIRSTDYPARAIGDPNTQRTQRPHTSEVVPDLFRVVLHSVPSIHVKLRILLHQKTAVDLRGTSPSINSD
ncbi:twitching motility protein PilT [Salinibacter ruber M8]|uniref:Twitching motility protein PilT n=1 Tax=Salinibacter ruber (strain M8) TaxID=761659 RepID=D5H8N4_SALRM|nr:twitching motility protein PilT [Salinibacter ruber M8]